MRAAACLNANSGFLSLDAPHSVLKGIKLSTLSGQRQDGWKKTIETCANRRNVIPFSNRRSVGPLCWYLRTRKPPRSFQQKQEIGIAIPAISFTHPLSRHGTLTW
jgi:hypothetical protein